MHASPAKDGQQIKQARDDADDNEPDDDPLQAHTVMLMLMVAHDVEHLLQDGQPRVEHLRPIIQLHVVTHLPSHASLFDKPLGLST